MSESPLLKDLHSNLWMSLRHIFNTDRILLAVLYTINFAGFLMLTIVSGNRPWVAVVTVVSLISLNGLILLSLKNSKREALALIQTLGEMYKDHELGKYFDEAKMEYYQRRYILWQILTPTLMLIAITLGLVLGFGSQ